MVQRKLLLVTVVALASVLGGCAGRAIREGLGVAVGAKGVAIPIKAVSTANSPRPLGQYERFELGVIHDDTNGLAPPELFTKLPGELDKQLAAKRIPNAPTGKALLIRGKVLHYEHSGLFGQVFGPLEEVVARLELVDKADNRVLGVANCVGRTKETINLGVATKAEGLAKAIAGWIDRLYPKDKRLESN